MKWEKQTQAYQLIERLVNSGKTLPISRERYDAIVNMKEPASTEDIQVLQEAVNKI